MRVLGLRAAAIVAALGLVMTSAAVRGQVPDDQSPAIPQGASKLEGLPAVRLDATKDDAKRRPLNRAEATKEKLTISIVNGQYYWTSRENRPLTLRSSGEFTCLSSADPGLYVRFRKVNDRIAYVEHVDSALGSVTYWGELRIVLGR